MQSNRSGHLTTVVVGLVFFLLLPDAGHSEPLSLVTGNDYLPYADEALPQGGLATAIVRQVLKAADIDHQEPDFKPWARALMETESTVYDATFPFARSTEREQALLYSEPFLSVTDTFFVRGDFPVTTLTPAHLEDQSVCRPLGYSQSSLQELKEAVSFNIESPQGAAQCLSMLERGRVDFFFINELTGRHAIDLEPEQYGGDIHSVPMPDHIGEVELHLVMSRENPRAEAVMERFNNSLREMKASGEIEGIVETYLQNQAYEP